MRDGAPAEPGCEVAVIGAGPAGSTAAYHLARAGVDVCLIDRALFPRDKVCGDLLGGDALDELIRLGIDPPKAWAGRIATISGCHVVGYGGRARDYLLNLGAGFGGRTYVVRRTDFDNVLRLAAIAAGARWLSPCRCHRVEPCEPAGLRVSGSTDRDGSFSVRANAVIQATGANASLKGPRGALSNGCSLVAGRRYYASRNVASDRSHFYYQDYLPLHYAWIFPMADGIVNAGLILGIEELRNARSSIELRFSRAIAGAADACGYLDGTQPVSPFRTAILPTALAANRLASGGILYVGDAGAMANPLNGEGIGPAMVSGRLAAETLVAARRRDGFCRRDLPAYEDAVNARYGREYADARKLFETVSKLAAAVSGAQPGS